MIVCSKRLLLRIQTGAFFLAVLASDSAYADIFRVSPDGDGSDGLTWQTAFNAIGDALTASASGDAIWIKSATYNESIILESGISLYGGFAGTEGDDEFSLRDWRNNVTTVDATGRGHSVVRGNSVNQVKVDGLALIRGNPSGTGEAGGVTLIGSHVTLRNCIVAWNQSEFGGGIRALSSSDLVCEHCSIMNNRDGGVAAGHSNLTMTLCVIDANVNTVGWGGGAFVWRWYCSLGDMPDYE